MFKLSKIRTKHLILLVILLTLAACNPFSGRGETSTKGFALLGIDPASQPVPVGAPITFSTAHADPHGVDRVEFYVNGQMQGQPQSPAFDQTYFIVENSWTPEASGQYEIKWLTYSDNKPDKDPTVNILQNGLTADSRILPVATVAGVAQATTTTAPLPQGGVVACAPNMLYISKNIPDNTTFPPNKPFVMSWRVQNTGTCTWDTTYFINNTSGPNFGAGKTFLPFEVRPEQMASLDVQMLAPMDPGTYTSQWNLFHPDGRTFGPALVTTIKVLPEKCFKNPHQPMSGWGGKQPKETPTPAPVDPDCVDQPVTPTPCANPPKINYFTANPASVSPGGASTLSWSVDGATSIIISPSSGVQAAGSTLTVSPDQTTTYTLTASNGDCASTAQVTITVGQQSCGGLDIASFTANPSTINVGGSSTLSWATTNASNIVLSANPPPPGVQSSSVLVAQSASTVVVSPQVTTVYTIQASNNVCTLTRQATVTVNSQ